MARRLLLTATLALLAGCAGPGAYLSRERLLAPGEIRAEDPKGILQGLAASVTLLDSSPTGSRLIAQWREAAGPDAPPLRANVRPMSGASGSAFGEGTVNLNAEDLVSRPFVAGILTHEWLGHKLCDLQLLRATGEEYPGLSTELISRIRGWRVWTELDPDEALRDRELAKFLSLGPRDYARWLKQPGRVYALSMDLADIAEPETFLRGKLAAIAKERKRPAPEPSRKADAFRHAEDPLTDELIRKRYLESMVDIGEKLLADDGVMAKYRRIAALPGVIALWAAWEREIEDFWSWGREQERRRQERFAARCAAARPGAEAGRAQAQRTLGYCLQFGLGLPQDFKAALDWYRRAAAGGDDAAQNNLGTMYRKGEGVAQDRREAAKWFRLAAEQGNPVAQFNLGGLYEAGEGVPADRVEAGAWYLRALRQGYGPASGRLASLALSPDETAQAKRRAGLRRRP